MDTNTGLCQLVKRINICMDKRKKKLGNICLFFADEIYLRLFKSLQFWELRYPMCIICIRRGTNIAIEANVRTIT